MLNRHVQMCCSEGGENMRNEILRYEAGGPQMESHLHLAPSFTGARPSWGEIAFVGEISGQAG